MKLAVNLVLSFGMLALCLWLVWPGPDDRAAIAEAIKTCQAPECGLPDFTHDAPCISWSAFWPYLLVYLGLMIVSHICRSLRWNYLLAPLGIRIPAGPLLAISSVGFMAILALPARLGEFVRPGLLRRRGISAAAALGTVAVERIIDGLMITLFVFGAFIARSGPDAPAWMMPTAFIALGVFVLALLFILFAMKRPEATVRFSIKMSLLDKLAPRIARVIETKLLDMIRGFAVLRDVANLTKFCIWTAVYWGANGFTLYVLARAFHLHDGAGDELSLIGAFAVMGIVGVGISLPNSPGLVGQYQALTLAGLALYLGPIAEKGGSLYPVAFAYAMTQHLFQVIWYVGTGALGLATPWVSIHDLRMMRKPLADDAPASAGTAQAPASSGPQGSATVTPESVAEGERGNASS